MGFSAPRESASTNKPAVLDRLQPLIDDEASVEPFGGPPLRDDKSCRMPGTGPPNPARIAPDDAEDAREQRQQRNDRWRAGLPDAYTSHKMTFKESIAERAARLGQGDDDPQNWLPVQPYPQDGHSDKDNAYLYETGWHLRMVPAPTDDTEDNRRAIDGAQGRANQIMDRIIKESQEAARRMEYFVIAWKDTSLASLATELRAIAALVTYRQGDPDGFVDTFICKFLIQTCLLYTSPSPRD